MHFFARPMKAQVDLELKVDCSYTSLVFPALMHRGTLKCWAESTCRGACSTERDVVVVGDAAKKARKGSIDTNIFGGAAPSVGRGRERERFPASLNIDHRIVPRFFSPNSTQPNLTRQTVKRREGVRERGGRKALKSADFVTFWP